MPTTAADDAPRSRQSVHTLLIQVSRRDGDGLPAGSTGAALLCYASGVDEAEAVREAVAVLKQAGMAPLDVTAYGTMAELLEAGDVSESDQTLMERARIENAVVVAEVTPFFD